MPRPRKLKEVEKKRAWENTHPKVASVPNKLRVPDAKKLLRGILGSGAVALCFACVFEYLSLAKVTDMNAARVILILGGSTALLGILVSQLLWGQTAKQKISFTIGSVIVLAPSLWSLDAWAVKHREQVKDFAPASVGTAVLIQPGAKWISTDDIVYGPDGRAIENRGEVDSRRLQVNPKNPVSPRATKDTVALDQLTKFTEEIRTLQGPEIPAWSAKVAQYLKENVDKNLATRFAAEPTLRAKESILRQCVQLVMERIHAS